jgi:putative ABC transport system substrate-binding protein
VNRREILACLAGILLLPIETSAQQQPGKDIRICLVDVVSAQLNGPNLAALRSGLKELGYSERRNLVIEYRSADSDARHMPQLLSELIELKVDLMVTRGTPAALAAKEATSTIPTVMAGLGEPLLVIASLARPAGNITGLSGMQPKLEPKRMDILNEMAPATSGIAALLNMSNPVTARQLKELERAAQVRGWRFRLLDVRSRDDMRAFRSLDKSSDAIVVGLEGLTQAYRGRIAELAARSRLPAIYGGRKFVEAGGLIFYGPSFPDLYQRAAVFIDRILKGAKPADLPIEQPAKLELVINANAAKALGLTIPPSLLARADEIVE